MAAMTTSSWKGRPTRRSSSPTARSASLQRRPAAPSPPPRRRLCRRHPHPQRAPWPLRHRRRVPGSRRSKPWPPKWQAPGNLPLGSSSPPPAIVVSARKIFWFNLTIGTANCAVLPSLKHPGRQKFTMQTSFLSSPWPSMPSKAALEPSSYKEGGGVCITPRSFPCTAAFLDFAVPQLPPS